ncbi:MAG: hypothetical protein H7210_04805 [Pyrinomonadaceae bacterium]|nr:hypothetical protein [Phycisphaerales bacterium]
MSSARRHSRRRIAIVAVLVTVGAGVYMAFPGLGFFSGTRLPREARPLTPQRQREDSEIRARSILAAIRAYKNRHGKLPVALASLVPQFLPEIPSPLTSTMPFQYVVNPDGQSFIVKWEAYPNSMYQRFWIDQDGKNYADL